MKRSTSARPIIAKHDYRMDATIIRRTPLVYAEGASEEQDRPPFVRAASGVAWINGELLLVQDDVSLLAIGAPGGPMRAVPLPPGPDGHRRFEDRLGNRKQKLDLESCLVLPDSRVCAFGSGSLPVRETIVLFSPQSSEVRLVPGEPLYSVVRRQVGTELNLEGATVIGDVLRLFQRGNVPGGRPATIDFELPTFIRWLDGEVSEPPPVRASSSWNLGTTRGVAFGFTDATMLTAKRALFLASAEASTDAVDDGEILGARIGWLEEGKACWAPLHDASGSSEPLKPEGVVMDSERPGVAWVVLDLDDPDRPAELCEVRLTGPWWD